MTIRTALFLPRRTTAALTGAAVGALLLAGCSFNADVTTAKPYAASDGIAVTVSGVTVQNLMVVSTGAGEQAVVLGSFTNTGTADAVVQLQSASSSPTVDVPAGTTVRLGAGEAETTVLLTSKAEPGGLEPMYVGVTGADSVRVDVPIMDGTLPEYQDVAATLG